MRKSRRLFAILVLMMPLMLMGCSGDDGSVGAQGPPGGPGPPGPPGPGGTASPESCAVCHSSVASTHAATGVVSVNGITQALDGGGNLVVGFNIKVDGINNDSFTPLYRGYVHFDNAALQTVPPTRITTFQRNTITSNVTLASIGAGNYTITVPAANVINNSNYLFVLTVGGVSHSGPVLEATVNVQYGAAHLRDLVSSDACASCHGPYPVRTEKFPHYRVGGAECQICHSQATRTTGFITRTGPSTFVEAGPFYGTNLTEYVHGIHNSHNMPDGVYYRTTAADGAYTTEDRYSIGFPSNMRNCKVCHKTPAQLATVAAAPVSYYLCMTCHNNWNGFVRGDGTAVFSAASGLDWHKTFTITVDCMNTTGCHGAVGARFNEAADFHNSFSTAQGTNSIYRGTDISFDNPNQVLFGVTGVTKAGDNVTFTWTATRNGTAVNPCNTDNNAGPTFRSLGAYLAYAKGDDWVNDNVGTSPGQPLSARNLFTSLTTTCSANVATTTGLRIAANTSYAEKVLLGIGGKPLDKGGLVPANDNLFVVRVPSPTYEFSMTDGSPVTKRRNVVDTKNLCLGCHQGTLYQHGGDRVDNVQFCVMCHNPSANDRNVREVTWQILNPDNTVNTDKTYDGKIAETYDIRHMLHAIHGVSKRGFPWVLYRGRGIYAFPPPVYEEIGGDLFERAYPTPTGWPGDGMTVYGSTNSGSVAHNWTVVHYPKPPSECMACHLAGTYEAAEQTKAVALTIDAGANYTNQDDDIVIGPSAAACTACHATAPVRTHTTQFGYRTNVTKDEMLILAQP